MHHAIVHEPPTWGARAIIGALLKLAGLAILLVAILAFPAFSQQLAARSLDPVRMPLLRESDPVAVGGVWVKKVLGALVSTRIVKMKLALQAEPSSSEAGRTIQLESLPSRMSFARKPVSHDDVAIVTKLSSTKYVVTYRSSIGSCAPFAIAVRQISSEMIGTLILATMKMIHAPR